MPTEPQKCLIVGPAWVGDMVMAQSLFIALRQQYPALLIDVLAPRWSEPLLAAMPEVNQSIVMPLGHGELGLVKRYRLGRSLRAENYDWSIVLPNSLKSALLPYWAGIPQRTGYKGEMRYGLLNDLRYLDKSVLTMTVQRFVALGHSPHPQQVPACPQPALGLAADACQQVLEKFTLRPQAFVALCPGAEYGPAKRWPERHFAALAAQLIGDGQQVLLLGSAKDQAVAADICRLLDSTDLIDLTGKTSLHEVIGLLQSASAAVSNDSGLMHIAAAVGTPVVALYGSSDPGFTPPLADHSVVVSLGLDCSPCFKRECPLGTLACLEGMSPEQVYSALQRLL